MNSPMVTMPVLTAMEVDQQEQHLSFAMGDTNLQLAISTAFSVQETGDIVIKQEPEDYIPEVPDELVHEEETEEYIPEATEDDEQELFENEDITDDNLAQVYPEINHSILQRAVSPPSYNDLDEQSIEELTLYYKDKYNLKDVSVLLESCDKIWETLQLIRNIQTDSDEDEDSHTQSLKSSSESQISGLLNIPPPKKRDLAGRPDFRYVGNKRKVYHCVTCSKLFVNLQSFKSHAIEVHKVFYSPKRMYKMRADMIAKLTREGSTIHFPQPTSLSNNDFSKKEIPQLKPQNVPRVQSNMQTRRKSINQTLTLPQHPLDNDVIVQKNESKLQEQKSKSVAARDKIKCILCKRICTDIKYHLKVFHKVGCMGPILDKCEKISTENFSDTNSEVGSISTISSENNSNQLLETSPQELESENHSQTPALPKAEPEIQSQKPVLVPPPDESKVDSIVEHPQVKSKPELQQKIGSMSGIQSAIRSELQPPIQKKMQPKPRLESEQISRKRKRRTGTSWTSKKRKLKKSNQHQNLVYQTGPFKCNICMGIYKTYKTFTHHRKIHQLRGETPQNFNIFSNRFKNSPLKPAKAQENAAQDHQKNSNIEVFDDTTTAQVLDLFNENIYKTEVCACGQVFRKSHSYFLHKVQCKKAIEEQSSLSNDTDPSFGISIKIKKNKNDSYEVVPSNTIEESSKELKSSKDSDISSNDSGIVSTDSNNQKIDAMELSKYSHSILRIQREDIDEEVDIEDENSTQSSLNLDACPTSNFQFPNNSESTLHPSKKTKTVTGARPVTRRTSTIPSLTNLCRQVLSNSNHQKEELSTFKCQTCAMDFETKNGLTEHESSMKHSLACKCACGKTFTNLKYYNIHVRRVHPLLLKCSYCNTNFDKVETYIDHKCEITEGKLFIEPIIQTECLVCKQLVDIEEPFDKHMKTHYDDSTYQCFKCDLKFENVYQRKAHFSKEHGFSKCQICQKQLHYEHLSKHEAYHDGLGYPCHICKKAFTQKVLFKKHVQNIHDPLVNEYVTCLVCSKNVRLKNLKKHMSLHVHTEICIKCNKSYLSDEQNNLNDHVALDHPNDYPARKCETCSLYFLSDKRYEEHLIEGTCMSNGKINFVQETKTT